MDESGLLRVSDDDRERYAVILRRAYAEGRITDGELEDRLQHVYRSRTEAELRTVVTDLPVAALSDRPAPAPRPSIRPRAAQLLGTLMAWYFPALICTAIWAITDFGGYFWPVWVFFGLSIPAGMALVAGLVFDEDDDDEGDAEDGQDGAEHDVIDVGTEDDGPELGRGQVDDRVDDRVDVRDEPDPD